MAEQPDKPSAPPPIQARPITRPPEWPAIPPAARFAPGANPLSELELPGLPRRQALLDLMLIILAAILVPYLPLFFALVTPGFGLEADVSTVMIAQTWCQALLALGLLLYMIMRHGMNPAAFGTRSNQLPAQFGWSIAALIVVYIVHLGTSLVVGVVYNMYPGSGEDLMKRLEFVEQMPVRNIGVTVVLLIAVAVNEEVIFRGLLLPYLRRLTGRWIWAVLISSVLFAVLHVPHQGLLGGIQILAIGAALSVFFLAARSLIAVIVAHFCFDFLQFQLIRLLPRLREILGEMPEIN